MGFVKAQPKLPVTEKQKEWLAEFGIEPGDKNYPKTSKEASELLDEAFEREDSMRDNIYEDQWSWLN
jgi:hypothetical protein